MPPAESSCTLLGGDERVGGRSFSDPGHTDADLAILADLRASLRHAAARERAPSLRFSDDVGVHHVVVPDWRALAAAAPVAIVGFFGQARDDLDHAPIVALEASIVARAASFRGLLAYHNARLANGQWGNLVAFASRAAAGGLAGDPQHASAVAATPRHYASLRLHRGEIGGGCLGSERATVSETLYLDFSQTPPWRALRAYERPPG